MATSDLEPVIPDPLLMQSGRPLGGLLLRVWTGLVLVGIGWIAVGVTDQAAWWGISVVGVLAFFAIPVAVASLVLGRFSRRVASIERSKVRAMLAELRDNVMLKLFAPHAWQRGQEGRLHLRVGDGRAAARAFAEAERVSKHPGDKAELISAQAHALTLAGDRKEARELFGRLAKLDKLTRLDHLDFGIALLSETGHAKAALQHLEKARDAYGGHPRVLAGLVVALQKVDRPAEAAELLDAAQAAVEDQTDPVSEELLKRGRKGLRTYLQARQKRERKLPEAAAPDPAPVRSEPPKSKAAEAKPDVRPPKPVAEPEAPSRGAEVPKPEPDDADGAGGPKGKKGRKQARRDARRRAKAEARGGARTEASPAPVPSPTQVEAPTVSTIQVGTPTVKTIPTSSPVRSLTPASLPESASVPSRAVPAPILGSASAPVSVAGPAPTPVSSPTPSSKVDRPVFERAAQARPEAGAPPIGGLPRFAPPPIPKASVVGEAKPEPVKPLGQAQAAPIPFAVPGVVPLRPTAPKLSAPAIPTVPAAPKLSVPTIPSAPAIPTVPALDDGWGDLGDLPPVSSPPKK